MKNLEQDDPLDKLSLELKSKEIETEEKIEEEIKKIDKIEDLSDNIEKEVWDGSQALLIEDNDAADYEENYSGIKLSFSLKERELFSCLRHCGWNMNHFMIGAFIFILVDIILLMLLVFQPSILVGICFVATVINSIFWIFNILPSFYNRLAYHKNLIGQKLKVEIYHDSIVINDGNKEETIYLNDTCKYEEFNNMLLIFLKDDKVFIIPKRAIEPDLLADVEAMLISGTKPIEED